MKDLKFEQKRSLSRLEAADQLSALAAALREGGDAELELGSATLSLRVPDALRSEVEVEVGNGEIELEIEFKWPTAPTRTAPSRTAAARKRPQRERACPPNQGAARRAPPAEAKAGSSLLRGPRRRPEQCRGPVRPLEPRQRRARRRAMCSCRLRGVLSTTPRSSRLCSAGQRQALSCARRTEGAPA